MKLKLTTTSACALNRAKRSKIQTAADAVFHLTSLLLEPLQFCIKDCQLLLYVVTRHTLLGRNLCHKTAKNMFLTRYTTSAIINIHKTLKMQPNNPFNEHCYKVNNFL